MLADTYTDYYVAPSAWLLVFAALVLLMLVGAIVTAAKGRWGWLVVGLLTGVTLLFSGFLPAAPGSAWQRRRARSGGDEPT